MSSGNFDNYSDDMFDNNENEDSNYNGEPMDPSQVPEHLKALDAETSKVVKDPVMIQAIQKAYLRSCMLLGKEPTKVGFTFLVDYFSDVASKYLLFKKIKEGMDIVVFPHGATGEIAFGFLGDEEKEAIKTLEEAEGGVADNLISNEKQRVYTDIPLSQLSRVRKISKLSLNDKSVARLPRWMQDQLQDS